MPKKTNQIIPILLEGPGRSGSTLLVQLVKTSPFVIADDKYPYEWRYINYFNSFSKSLLESESPPAESKEVALEVSIKKLTPPFKSSLKFNVDFHTELLKNIWDTFERYLISQNPSAIYYVEKSPLGLTKEIRKIIPETKSIYRIRDPRSIWVSIIEFDKKRGYFGFGRSKQESENAYLNKFIKSQAAYLETAINVKENGNPNDLLVKYEDIITNTKTEIERISEFLDIQLNHTLPMNNFSIHATSNNPIESISKWKNLIDASTNEKIIFHLGEMMNALGYDTQEKPVNKNNSIPKLWRSFLAIRHSN